jgi:hypothetical protein
MANALVSLSDVVNLATGGNSGTPETIWFHRQARVGGAAAAAPVAGRWSSLWQYDGAPSNGAKPTTVANPTASTAGGLRQANPGGSRTKWMTSLGVASNAAGTAVLVDRLLHIGGLSGTSTSAQTVAGSLSRYTDGLGVEAWIEIYTQIGASATTVSMNYDSDSATNQTSPAQAIGGTGLREAQRLIRLPVAAGHRGVKVVNNVTLAATTSTAGEFGVTLVRPLAWGVIGVGGTGALVNLLSKPVEISTDSCLALAWLAPGTTTPEIEGFANFIEKA